MTAVFSYSTVSEMLVTLPVVSSRTSATSAELAVFGERGETLMNATLAKRYVLPFAQVIPLLRTLSTDMACYQFLSRRVFTQERDNKSAWPDRFKESMETLGKIASGEIPLIGIDGGVIPESAAQIQIWSNTQDYEPAMTEDHVTAQIVDPDKIDDIRDERYEGYWGPPWLQ